MGTAAIKMPKCKRARHSAEYRAVALALAERIGVAGAASELGLHAEQIDPGLERIKMLLGVTGSPEYRQVLGIAA